jgi:hypothetical protein
MKDLSSMVSVARVVTAGAIISAVVAACGNAAGPPQQTIDGSGGSGGSVGAGATGGLIGTGGGNGTGGGVIGPDGSTGGPCVRIGMLGRLPSYGAVPGMDSTAALQQWLNSKSTAMVATYVTDTPITEDFLAQYDVLILQALEAAEVESGPRFQYDAVEIAAFEAWVRAGGGVITLTGYGRYPAEVDPTNQLVAFTGLSYAKDDILGTGTCPDNDCCCASNSIPVTGWNAAHPVAANLTRVGALHGRSVLGGGDVVAQGATVYGATKQMDLGRVFVFADEWVTYTSQWDGTGADTCETDPGHNYCTNRLAQQYYQVPQFWYNSIKWVSGDRECFDFDADVPIVR